MSRSSISSRTAKAGPSPRSSRSRNTKPTAEVPRRRFGSSTSASAMDRFCSVMRLAWRAAAGLDVRTAFELKLDGPLDRLGVDINVRSSAGQVTGTLTADLAAPGYAATGNVAVQHVNLAPILGRPSQASDVTGHAAVDLQ